MTLDNFVKSINDELSQDCSIPFQIPKRSLIRIIKRAKKWFYRNYEYAVEECYLFIKKAAFETTQFKDTRTLKLPDNVQSIINLHKVPGNGLSGDFNIERLAAEDIFRQNYTINRESGGLDYYIINQVYYDHFKFLLTTKINFNYNHLTKNFKIIGEIPLNDVALLCYVHIADSALFNDDLFFDYVLGMAMQNLKRILGTIQMPLIGNATIDYDSLKTEGEQLVEKVKTEIDNNEGVDWFIGDV